MSKREKWEDQVRSKLENFETDTHSEDWNAILDRLPQVKRVIPLRKWYYAAAIMAGLVFLSGGYFLLNMPGVEPIIADTQVIESPSGQGDTYVVLEDENSESLEGEVIDNVAEQNRMETKESINKQNPAIRITKDNNQKPEHNFIAEKLNAGKQVLDIENPLNHVYSEQLSVQKSSEQILFADATPARTNQLTGKRWGFGVGGGSYSMGTDGGGIPGIAYPTTLSAIGGDIFKASANVENKQNVSHKRPLSFGVGVGYALNDRWSLQSGLYYTMLRSEWWYMNEYQGVSRQKLHFLGVPLGVSYRIAEWQKFQLYASAGGMTEWNFSGQIRTDFYADSRQETIVARKNEPIRTKEWQWSVNGKIGVNYPLFRFVNAFAEGGVNYYFDNGSTIETIRSEKPFHVTLQAGLRLGF